MRAWRDGIENVAAVELAAGDQVQRGDEQTNPSCDKQRVGRSVVEGGEGWLPAQQQGVDEADGERLAAERNDGDGRIVRQRTAEQKALGHGQDRGGIADQRTVDAHIHESVAGGNEGADSNYGAGCAAECGSRQNPGKRASYAVNAAGKIVAKFVDEQNAQQ